MAQASRILVGLVAAFFIFMGLNFWFMLDTAVTSFGFGPDGLIGRASVRADVGGFFLGGGIIAAMAAWKRCSTLATASLILVATAITGRIVSLVLDGAAPGGTPPMVVEAVMIAILLWARSQWRTR